MKKIILFTLIASFIYLSQQEEQKGCQWVNTSINDEKASDCRNVSCDEDDKKNGYTHVCLFILKDKSEICQGVSDDAYENIKKHKKYWEEHKGVDIKKIKCGSSYLSHSLILMAFLALFF